MIEQDTIRLLREADAGIKMGVSSIEDSMKHIKSEKFREIMRKSLQKHRKLQAEMQTLLADYHDDGKEPAMMAKGMEWFKTNVSLAMDDCDGAVADFIVDGCNMGSRLAEEKPVYAVHILCATNEPIQDCCLMSAEGRYIVWKADPETPMVMRVDEELTLKPGFYYPRITTVGGNMAWASPIWIGE